MSYAKHHDYIKMERGGKVLSGTSNYDNEQAIDTPAKLSKFDLSHSHKGTAKCGVIFPTLSLFVNAGDEVKLHSTLFQRFRPLVNPIVSTLETTQHTFALPLRMLDYGFEKFFTGGTQGNYNKNLLHVDGQSLTGQETARNTLYGPGSLWDYFNMPSSSTNTDFNLFPLIAFSRVYNDYYRVKEIETDLWCDPDDSMSSSSLYRNWGEAIEQMHREIGTAYTSNDVILHRKVQAYIYNNPVFTGFMHTVLYDLTSPHGYFADHGIEYYERDSPIPLRLFDYQTKTLDANNVSAYAISAVATVPLTAPGTGKHDTQYEAMCVSLFYYLLLMEKYMPYERDRFTTALPYLQRGTAQSLATVIRDRIADETGRQSVPVTPTLNNCSIYDIRQLSAVTRFLERSARIGYVWDDFIRGVFGVTDSAKDVLSKPYYVGGSKFDADVETVVATAETAEANLGEYRANATSFGDSGNDTYHAGQEPSIIISVCATKPRLQYTSPLDRNILKYGDRTSFYQPDFAYVTEQPVFACEMDKHIYPDGEDFNLGKMLSGKDTFGYKNVSDMVIGYEPRYNEYRSHASSVHGELVTNLKTFSASRRWSGLAPEVGCRGFALQHCLPSEDNVNMLFQVNEQLADHFVYTCGWDISTLSTLPDNPTPTLI